MLTSRDQVRITDNNLGPVVNICAVVLVVPTVLAVGGRIFTKTAVLRKYSWDDYIIFAAFVMSLGQTAAVLAAAANGLGQHWDVLDDSTKIRFQKSTYASSILLVVTLVLTKLSIISFIQSLAPSRRTLVFGYCFGGVLLLWGLSSLSATLFRCAPPDVWRQSGRRCVESRAFWTAFDALNITTDLVLVVWPVIIISQIQTGLWRRMVVIFCFASRLLVIGAIAAEISFLQQSASSSDISFKSWQRAICSQLMLCLSISTACIPYLRPFLDSLESGLLKNDDLRRRGVASAYYSTKPAKSTAERNFFSLRSTKRSSASDKTVQDTRIANFSEEMPLRPFPYPISRTKVHAEPGHFSDDEKSTNTRITLSTSWSVGQASSSMS
ncbi:hypothetical protein BJ875DRAFT_500727 [Amylocarpus encephaloides]|uniref:Rhodopsin domain-containing protein n=1 Tax=Amylocarpus encephaloides TaxID=45428 RepID=A0A9P7Y8L0_9HELO|nr:hypothetical protein BJ875DRAFT_500727 [Amylocarpus encephaloides]